MKSQKRLNYYNISRLATVIIIISACIIPVGMLFEGLFEIKFNFIPPTLVSIASYGVFKWCLRKMGERAKNGN